MMFEKNNPVRRTSVRRIVIGALALLSLFSMILVNCTLEPTADDLQQKVLEGKSYTVSFDVGVEGTTEGLTVPDSQTVKYGKYADAPDNLAISGYIFDGWYRNDDGTGPWNFVEDEVTASITLYAKWTAEGPGVLKVTFDENGGTSEASPNTKSVVDPATTVDALPTPPARTGWKFVEWNTAADRSGDVFTKDTVVASDGTVYAIWQAVVSFNNNGGPGSAPAAITVTTPETTVADTQVGTGTLPTPTRSGYAFTGWYTDKAATTEFLDTTSVPGNITLYAGWIPIIDYTVTANGAANTTTSNKLIFTFTSTSADIDIGDITITPAATNPGVAVPLSLDRVGTTNVWELTIDDTLVVQGNIIVNITKTGIQPAGKTAAVYEKGIEYAVTADGGGVLATTTLTFTFVSVLPSALALGDITLTPVAPGAATKGVLTKNSDTEYDLTILAVAQGDIKVKINKDGVDGAERTVTVYDGAPAVLITYTVTPHDTASTTTSLSFVLSAAPASDLAVGDITIAGSGGSPGAATKGTLSKTDDTHYELGITTTAAGTAEVTIANHTDIKTDPVGVSLNLAGPPPSDATVISVTPNGTLNTADTTTITIVLSKAVPGLDEGDLTIGDGGDTGEIAAGTMSSGDGGTTYVLNVTSVTTAGTVTIGFDSVTDVEDYSEAVTVHKAQVLLASGSEGTAGNGTITDLTTGEYYKLEDITNDDVYYVKADGSLSSDLTNIRPLEAPGAIEDPILINGNTYKVTAATPFATTPLEVFDHPGDVPPGSNPHTTKAVDAAGALTLDGSGNVLWGIDLQLDTSKTYEVMRITSGSPAVASTTASPLWTASKSSGVYDSDSDAFISDDPPKDVGIFIYPVDSGEPTWIRGMSIVYAHVDSGVSSDFLIVYEDGTLKVLTVSVP